MSPRQQSARVTAVFTCKNWRVTIGVSQKPNVKYRYSGIQMVTCYGCLRLWNASRDYDEAHNLNANLPLRNLRLITATPYPVLAPPYIMKTKEHTIGIFRRSRSD